MLIRCSACNSKYLVNSADLKPDGRMVECASCGHQWYQELSTEEEILFPSAPSSKNDHKQTQDITNTKIENNQKNEIKNLPSTFVMEQKTSVMNSFLVLITLVGFIATFFLLRSYGVNIFVLQFCINSNHEKNENLQNWYRFEGVLCCFEWSKKHIIPD